MKITDIRQQQRQTHRYSIYLDGRYSFSLSRTQLAERGLHLGQELDANDMKKLKSESDFGKKYDRTLRWLAIRPRSAWEIDTYLARVAAEPGMQKGILARLEGLGLVDDRGFAQSWVDSRRALKAVSRHRLQQELRAKRVPADIIEEVLAEDETDDIEVLKGLIQRKIRLYGDRQKLLSYLARQGWRYDDIRRALDELE
jgi:regulatory protein